MSRRNQARRRRNYAPRQREVRRRRSVEEGESEAANGFGWRHATDEQAASQAESRQGPET